MVKYFVGIVGSLLGALAGAWLMVSPFALAYQPQGADWINATHVSFWTGLGLVVFSAVGLAMYALGLYAELREIGVIGSVRRSGEGRETGSPASPDNASAADRDQLTPLIAEMLREMQQERQQEIHKEVQDDNRNGVGTHRDEQAREGRVSGQ